MRGTFARKRVRNWGENVCRGSCWEPETFEVVSIGERGSFAKGLFWQDAVAFRGAAQQDASPRVFVGPKRGGEMPRQDKSIAARSCESVGLRRRSENSVTGQLPELYANYRGNFEMKVKQLPAPVATMAQFYARNHLNKQNENKTCVPVYVLRATI